MRREYGGRKEVLTSGLHRSGVLLILLTSVCISSVMAMSCIRAEAPPAPAITGGVEGGVIGGVPIYRYAPRRTPARILHRVEPELTEQAVKARVQGILVAALYVDDQGIVRSVRILKGLPFGLDDKAVEAFSEWRFEPARNFGRPVASVYEATVSFPPLPMNQSFGRN